MKQPFISAMVIFHEKPTSSGLAAIVTGVNEEGKVNLIAFYRDGGFRPWRKICSQSEVGEGTEQPYWRWPPELA